MAPKKPKPAVRRASKSKPTTRASKRVQAPKAKPDTKENETTMKEVLPVPSPHSMTMARDQPEALARAMCLILDTEDIGVAEKLERMAPVIRARRQRRARMPWLPKLSLDWVKALLEAPLEPHTSVEDRLSHDVWLLAYSFLNEEELFKARGTNTTAYEAYFRITDSQLIGTKLKSDIAEVNGRHRFLRVLSLAAKGRVFSKLTHIDLEWGRFDYCDGAGRSQCHRFPVGDRTDPYDTPGIQRRFGYEPSVHGNVAWWPAEAINSRSFPSVNSLKVPEDSVYAGNNLEGQVHLNTTLKKLAAPFWWPTNYPLLEELTVLTPVEFFGESPAHIGEGPYPNLRLLKLDVYGIDDENIGRITPSRFPRLEVLQLQSISGVEFLRIIESFGQNAPGRASALKIKPVNEDSKIAVFCESESGEEAPGSESD